MPRRWKGGPVKDRVADLVRDRLKEDIDDTGFRQGISSIIESMQGIASIYFDIGETLAKSVARYLYLLTDSISADLARSRGPDWAIVLKWGRGQLRDTLVKKLCTSRLVSPENKAEFEQRLTDLLRESQGNPDSVEKLHAEVLGGLLDHFFYLADGVDVRIRQDFEKHHIRPMNK